MGTVIYNSINTPIMRNNLNFLAYCIEEPREILREVFKRDYRIDSYKDFNHVDPFGVGLVIKHHISDNNYGLTFENFETLFGDDLEKKKFTPKNLILPFKSLSGPIIIKRKGNYETLFDLLKEKIKLKKTIKEEYKNIVDSSKEFVEVLLNKELNLDDMIKLYNTLI